MEATRDKDLVLAEYNTLRSEVMQHMDTANTIFRFSLTGSVVILAWGIAEKQWLILLTPIPIMLVSIVMMLSAMGSMFRIATYIRTFIEPNHPELNWESRVAEAAAAGGGNLVEILYNIAIAISYLSVAAVSLLMSYTYAGNENPITAEYAQTIVLAVIAICVVVAAVAAVRILIGRTGVEEQHLELWRKVAQKETAPAPGLGEEWEAVAVPETPSS